VAELRRRHGELSLDKNTLPGQEEIFKVEKAGGKRKKRPLGVRARRGRTGCFVRQQLGGRRGIGFGFTKES